MDSINFYLLIFTFINFLIILKFDQIEIFHLLLDKPNSSRKFHLKPIPIAGGLIVIINLFIFFIITIFDKNIISNEVFFDDKNEFYFFFLISTLIFILGYLDDMFDINANLKFLLLSLLIFIILILDESLNIKSLSISFINEEINLSYISFFFSCFCFLVFINSFNMFDGINLQSAFYSIIILTSLILFYSNSLLLKILLIVFITYSYLNFKNKSFLGDGGSLLISFIIGYLFIKLYNLEKISFADEIFIFMMIPGIDMVRLFFKRILNKRNPFSSDRLHLHHFLILKFSHAKTILIICTLILAPIILMLFGMNQLTIILLTIIVYSFLMKFI